MCRPRTQSPRGNQYRGGANPQCSRLGTKANKTGRSLRMGVTRSIPFQARIHIDPECTTGSSSPGYCTLQIPSDMQVARRSTDSRSRLVGLVIAVLPVAITETTLANKVVPLPAEGALNPKRGALLKHFRTKAVNMAARATLSSPRVTNGKSCNTLCRRCYSERCLGRRRRI